ncbi:MAG: hypothetical protein ACI9JZ_002904, partial [Lentimonas sp.]
MSVSRDQDACGCCTLDNKLTGCRSGTLLYSVKFDWDPEKNEWLKAERGISFEEIALLLSNGVLWKHAQHPNQKDYPQQAVFLIPIDNYSYCVPYVIDADTIFLKTAFPHRKATRDYLKEKG